MVKLTIFQEHLFVVLLLILVVVIYTVDVSKEASLLMEPSSLYWAFCEIRPLKQICNWNLLKLVKIPFSVWLSEV